MNAPSEINAGLSISRPRCARASPRAPPICSIAMLLEACAISAAPPITLNAIAPGKRRAHGDADDRRGHHHHPGGLEQALALGAAERVGDEAAERAADADRGEQQAEARRARRRTRPWRRSGRACRTPGSAGRTAARRPGAARGCADPMTAKRRPSAMSRQGERVALAGTLWAGNATTSTITPEAAYSTPCRKNVPGAADRGDEIARDRRAEHARQGKADRVERHRLHRELARHELERGGEARRPVHDVGGAHQHGEGEQHPGADDAERERGAEGERHRRRRGPGSPASGAGGRSGRRPRRTPA